MSIHRCENFIINQKIYMFREIEKLKEVSEKWSHLFDHFQHEFSINCHFRNFENFPASWVQFLGSVWNVTPTRQFWLNQISYCKDFIRYFKRKYSCWDLKLSLTFCHSWRVTSLFAIWISSLINRKLILAHPVYCWNLPSF